METTETVRTAQEVCELSVPIVSSIKNAAKRFKKEGRIEDADFAERLITIMVTEVQIYEEMEKCDEESDTLSSEESFEAFKVIEEKELLNMIALFELIDSNRELYIELTGVKVSKEYLDGMRKLRKSI